MAQSGARLLYMPEEQFDWSDAQHLQMDSHPYPQALSQQTPQYPFPPPVDFHIQGPRPRPYAPFVPKRLIASPLRTSKSSHTFAAKAIQSLPDNGEPLTRIRHSRNLVGYLSKYCLAQNQSLLNRPPHVNHPAFQPGANPPSSWSDFTTHLGTLPSAPDQARALDQLRNLYLVQTGRSTVIVNGEPAVAAQVYAQICEPINEMLKTRYRELPKSWKPGSGRSWILTAARSKPESLYPHWSYAVFKNKQWGTQSKLSNTTEKAGACDGLLFATLFDNPAILEIKTWWSISKKKVMKELLAIAARGGDFYWTPVSHQDSPGISFIKQIWGELNAYQSRFGVFVNGHHVAFVIRTRKNELTFSDFIEWEDREVYTAFLGFSMAAIDVVLSGPPAQYAERLRNIINLLCPREDRKIKVDGQDHPDDDNDDDAGEELF